MAGFDSVSNVGAQQYYNNTSPNSPQKATVTAPIKLEKRTFTTAEVSAAVLATALVATTIGGAVLHGKYKNLKSQAADLQKSLNKATGADNATKVKVQELETDLNTVRAQKGQLEIKNTELEAQNTQLGARNSELEEQLNNILNNRTVNEDDIVPVIEALKARMADAKLGYDIESPHIIRRPTKTYNDLVDLPTESGTTNRAGMQVLDIPQIKRGRFELEIPMSEEVTIVKAKAQEVIPEHNVKTTISEDYAESVQWNSDKIARDILQNFYDGHGQTLDGVKIKVEPVADGKFKVRIEGQSTYSPDKAILLGESSKRDNANAAGNYGEGLKMTTLKLLHDCGTEDVVIGSNNWRLNYNLQKADNADKRVLTYSLDKASEVCDGNFYEFETSNPEIVQSLRRTINRFYHSGNEHFKCPDFENGLFAIKLLKEGEKGGIYIAGQRFEFNGDYDGFKEMVLFIKEKPPISVLDPSRDRTSLDSSDARKLVEWLVKASQKTTKEERLQLIKALEPIWTAPSSRSEGTRFLDDVLKTELWHSEPLHIKFPERYVAYSRCDDSILQAVKNNGYEVCSSKFSSLGMKNIAEVYGEARKHTPILPTPTQERRIILLKDAISKLSAMMKKLGFTDAEIDAKIHLFDRKAPNEKMHSNALAEAIIDRGESKGFWIDSTYLQEAKFGNVLETALHELSHKVGGDSTSEFSYKLTDVNEALIDEVLNNSQLRQELRAISALWEESV